ncbi:MAG TPA: aldo/keto reductase [Gammaproteobacteria bacterium]|nr:aldo/keto reductase [Gammaproteobacteria bacterium]
MGAIWSLAPRLIAAQQSGPLITRPIPSTGERLPVIGLGSSTSFSQAAGQDDTEAVRSVLAKMIELGGKVFDTAPGYGASEQLAGKIVKEIDTKHEIFWATKLNAAGWGGRTADPKAARAQVAESFDRLGRDKIDLIQVHNVADLEGQFPILRELKQQGRVRYIGTTSTFKGQYDVLERFMKATNDCDFIGIDYSVDNLSAEERILPLAQEKNIAVLGYMPTGRKRLFEVTKGHDVPDWAREFGAQTWGQFILKFAASHPAMTVVTPATSKVEHMVDNMGAAHGRLPTDAERKRMVDFIAKLPG